MPIQVTCGCGRAFTVKDEFAGRRGKCPGCGQGVTVPRPGADDDLLPVELPPPPAKRAAGCHAHPQIPPKGACCVCAKLLCARCVCEVEGSVYCQSCMTTAGAFRGTHEERAEGLVTKSYKAYFNADTGIAALRSARLTLMNGRVVSAFMVALSFLLYYLQPIAGHYTKSAVAPIALGVAQVFAMIFLECAFVGCVRDALFQKAFGIGRFFHYGARYFLRYFLCFLIFYGVVVAAYFALALQLAQSQRSRVPALIAFCVALIAIATLFFYARLLVVLEDASPFAAVRRSVAFGLRYWKKVLFLAVTCGCSGAFMVVKGVSLYSVFAPEWAARMLANLSVFIAVGTQIAASLLLYLSLLPDEDAFRRVLPPDDVPETSGPLAVRVCIGTFVAVLGLSYWASHLPRRDDEGQGPTSVINKFGEKILKAARPTAKVAWRIDAGGPIVQGPVAAGADVLVCVKDTMQRRRGTDGSLAWGVKLPGRAIGPPMHDGERAFVECAWLAPKTEQFPYGEPKAALVAVRLGDGVVAWQADLPRPCESLATAEVAGDLVLVPSRVQLHAFGRADGKPAWETARQPIESRVGPARAMDDGVYFACEDDKIHVLDPKDGSEVRTLPYSGLSVHRKPVVTSDSVYETAGNTVIRLDRKTGTRHWEHNLGLELTAPSMPLEVIDGVPLYLYNGALWTIEPAKGETAWVTDPGEQDQGLDRDGHPIKTEPFLAEGFVVDGKELVVLVNGGEMLGRIDTKTGVRGDILDLPVDPPPKEREDGEVDVREMLEWSGGREPSDPLILGRRYIFSLRGKVYAFELP